MKKSELRQLIREEIKSIKEVLSEYEEWADINNPIDYNKNPLKIGNYVKMDDLSPFGGRLKQEENKWKIKSFNTGTSAGVEAIIVNKFNPKMKRSEATRFLFKTR